MATTVVCDYTFEAAHFLPQVHKGHPCGRMHGHSYKLEVHVAGTVQPSMGWVIDFGDIDVAVGPILTRLDHHLLNEIDGLSNPTLEKVAAWLWQQLHKLLPGLVAVVVHESHRSRCCYTGP